MKRGIVGLIRMEYLLYLAVFLTTIYDCQWKEEWLGWSEWNSCYLAVFLTIKNYMAINEKRNGWVGQDGIPATWQSFWQLNIIRRQWKEEWLGWPGWNTCYLAIFTTALLGPSVCPQLRKPFGALLIKKTKKISTFKQSIEQNLPGYFNCRKSLHGNSDEDCPYTCTPLYGF